MHPEDLNDVDLDAEDEEHADIDYLAVGSWAAYQLLDQLQRHPYRVLGVAVGVGLALAGPGTGRWLVAGALIALREAGRWAAREALLRVIDLPDPTDLGERRAAGRSRSPLR